MMKTKKQQVMTGLVIFLFGVFISMPLMFSSMYTETDPYIHVLVAAQKLKDVSFFTAVSDLWLPLHHFFIGVSLFLYNDIYIAPRILSLFFSLGSVVILYFFSIYVLQFSNKNAIISSLLYLFFPLRFFTSTFPLMESTFIFWFMLSLVFLFKKFPNYLLGTIFLMISQGIRYEAWFITPIIISYLLQKNIPKKKKTIMFFSLLIVPFSWIMTNLIKKGNLFAFLFNKVNTAQNYSIIEYGDLGLSFNHWWANLVEIYPLLFLLITFFGIYKYLLASKNSQRSMIPVIIVFLYISLVVQVFLGTMEWFPHRYLLIIISFMIPFLVFGFNRLLKIIVKPTLTKEYLYYLLFTIFFLIVSVYQIQTLTIRSKEISMGSYNARVVEDFNEIVSFCSSSRCQEKSLYYFHSEIEPMHLLFALQYHLGLSPKANEFQKSKLNKMEDILFDSVVILEKDLGDNEKNLFSNNWDILIDNNTFLVLKNSNY